MTIQLKHLLLSVALFAASFASLANAYRFMAVRVTEDSRYVAAALLLCGVILFGAAIGALLRRALIGGMIPLVAILVAVLLSILGELIRWHP